MIKYYDEANHRLVYVGIASDENFWDSHWQREDFERHIKVRKNRFIVGYTKRYLPKDSKILEGGCGRGDKVYALQANGYEAYGVDYARKTVEKINYYAPELRVTLGDVRELDFPDGFFDGYWSLGVIEHFYDGYDPILREMYRVLRSRGYLFMMVPAMSWLRKQKAKLGRYPEYKENHDNKKNFYQFALDPKSVIERFESYGFNLIKLRTRGGMLGSMDEAELFKPLLQWFNDTRFLPVRVVRKVVDILLITPFANHVAFYIFRKI